MANKLFSELAKGTYNGATAYTVGDFVDYNGSSYACIENSTGNLPTDTDYWALLAEKGEKGDNGDTGEQGIQGEKGDKGDKGDTGEQGIQGIQGEQGIQGIQGVAGENGTDGDSFTWLGEYAGGTTYNIGEAVSYNGSSYMCKLSSTGNLPTNTTYWDLMAAKGTDGSGTGDVTGAASSTNNAITRFSGTTGKTIKNSDITIDDNNYIQMYNGRIMFGGYTDRYLADAYGFSLIGNATRPIQVRSTSLLVGINAAGADYGTGNIHITGNIYQNGSSTGRLIIANNNTSGTDYTATFPAKSGTVAMTSDITSSITTTTLSGNQSATLSANTRYILNVADGEVQENTLPATFAVGDVVEIISRIATPPDLIAIYVNSGDSIEFVDENGDIITESSGISFEYSGSVRLVATVANSTWRVESVTGYNVLSSLAAPIRADVNALTTTSTSTVTNKRITARVYSTTSSATPAINTDNYDAVTITALATNITSMTTSLSGTPTNFQKLIIRIKDDGTARSITWGTGFEAKGVALPTTTVISKVLTVGFIYDTVTSKWGCVASSQEA